MGIRVNAGSDGLAELLPRAGPRRRIDRRTRRRESKCSQTYGDPLPDHATIVASFRPFDVVLSARDHAASG
jgi:hypothetical protein